MRCWKASLATLFVSDMVFVLIQSFTSARAASSSIIKSRNSFSVGSFSSTTGTVMPVCCWITLLTATGWFVASNALKSPMVKSLPPLKVSFLLDKRQNLPPGVQCEAEIIPERSQWFSLNQIVRREFEDKIRRAIRADVAQAVKLV